mmetsp:Transcript_28640/g.80664  ORF Transcript_28640/g.80664 Transcript_28640/m.80664 type:complete len:124 (+) Transcript_28640:92-463(+)
MSMQFLIPAESRRRLVEELGYHPEEVAAMDPSLAMSVLDRALKRPFGDSPMPEKWKSKAHKKQVAAAGGRGGSTARQRTVTLLILGVAAGAAAFQWWRAKQEELRRQAARQRLIDARRARYRR